jgi:hypothetical protein
MNLLLSQLIARVQSEKVPLKGNPNAHRYLLFIKELKVCNVAI